MKTIGRIKFFLAFFSCHFSISCSKVFFFLLFGGGGGVFAGEAVACLVRTKEIRK